MGAEKSPKGWTQATRSLWPPPQPDGPLSWPHSLHSETEEKDSQKRQKNATGTCNGTRPRADELARTEVSSGPAPLVTFSSASPSHLTRGLPNQQQQRTRQVTSSTAAPLLERSQPPPPPTSQRAPMATSTFLVAPALLRPRGASPPAACGCCRRCSAPRGGHVPRPSARASSSCRSPPCAQPVSLPVLHLPSYPFATKNAGPLSDLVARISGRIPLLRCPCPCPCVAGFAARVKRACVKLFRCVGAWGDLARSRIRADFWVS